MLSATHGQVFQLVVKLLELERFESVVELVRGIGSSLRTPPNPETSSDEAMMETHEIDCKGIEIQNSVRCQTQTSGPQSIWSTRGWRGKR